MLVLTRKEKQSFTITMPDGREIKVVVTKLGGNQVRLGIITDRDIKVERYDEEQKLESETILMKKKMKVGGTDSEFVSIWLDSPIPQYGGKTAREIVRQEPKELGEVLLIIKQELSNAFIKL